MCRVFFVVFFLPFLLFGKAIEDPQAILEKVDAYRGYSSSFKMDISVKDYSHDQLKNQLEFRAFIKDRSSSYLKYLYPLIDQKKVLLMVNENIWFYGPKIRQALRLSSRQRLLGNVSNADVARANFSFDYEPVFLGYQDIKGISCIKLELKPKHRKVAYGQIILYVDSKNYKPVKGDFFVLSGQLLKTAYYVDFKVYDGHERVTQIDIYDAIVKHKKTVLVYDGYGVNDLPDRYYNPQFLARIK